MTDTEPPTAQPAPAAGDAPLQEAVDAVQLAEIEKKDDAQGSSDPISPPAPKPTSPENPTSSEPSAPSDSPTKGKEEVASTAGASAAEATATTAPADNPPALPTKEGDDSLTIEPTSASPAPPPPASSSSSPENPVCNITLLLPTGARHPYRIDERYLLKRHVAVPDATEAGHRDPFSISVYTLKELILREWRDEWNDKPASPSSIRLIHFGKLLDDKEQLKKYQFSRETPNVVHMSVRPAEMLEEDEAAKGKSSGREGRTREGGNACCVIL